MTHDVWQPPIWCKGAMPNAQQLPALVRLRRDLRLAAQFSAYALNTSDLQALADETCRVAAEGLGACFAKLLVYQPEERAFVLQAGVGWPDGIVGQARFDTDVCTPAGFAWQSGQAVICNNLVTDEYFRVPDLLIEHDIVRSINVVVPGDGDRPFGVLEVESPEEGEFGMHDAHFLHVLTYSLASAIALHARQALHAAQSAECTAFYETSLLEMQHRVCNSLHAISSSIADEARRIADAISARASRGSAGMCEPWSRSIITCSTFQSPSDIHFLDHVRMPHNLERCQALARAWTENADQLSPGSKRDIYLEIAAGYAGLADLVNDVSSHLSAKAS